MVKFARYILGAGLIFGATAAMAGDLPPEMAEGVMNTCRADYHRLCSDVVPGDGRAARCLLDNQRELAPPCLKAVKLAYAIHACMPDIHRYCEGVPRGPQAFGCLAERMDMLRPECRRVITANAPYMMPPGGERYGYNGGGQGPYGRPGPYSPGQYGSNPYAFPYAPDDGRDTAQDRPAPRPRDGYGYAPPPPPRGREGYGYAPPRERQGDEDRDAEERSGPRQGPDDDRYAGREGGDRDGAPGPDEDREPSR